VQAWPAAQLRSRGDTGILLLLRQSVAVLLRGGAETGAAGQLVGRARVPGFDSPLLAFSLRRYQRNHLPLEAPIDLELVLVEGEDAAVALQLGHAHQTGIR